MDCARSERLIGRVGLPRLIRVGCDSSRVRRRTIGVARRRRGAPSWKSTDTRCLRACVSGENRARCRLKRVGSCGRVCRRCLRRVSVCMWRGCDGLSLVGLNMTKRASCMTCSPQDITSSWRCMTCVSICLRRVWIRAARAARRGIRHHPRHKPSALTRVRCDAAAGRIATRVMRRGVARGDVQPGEHFLRWRAPATRPETAWCIARCAGDAIARVAKGRSRRAAPRGARSVTSTPARIASCPVREDTRAVEIRVMRRAHRAMECGRRADPVTCQRFA